MIQHEWSNQHSPYCPVTAARALLLDGANSMDARVLHGCIVEWDAGGDEEAEACDCSVASAAVSPVKRYAIVNGSRGEREVARYLPDNYEVVAQFENEGGKPVVVIAGRDSAGWTLDGYVIPRLASGLISAVETDLSDPLMKKVPA